MDVQNRYGYGGFIGFLIDFLGNISRKLTNHLNILKNCKQKFIELNPLISLILYNAQEGLVIVKKIRRRRICAATRLYGEVVSHVGGPNKKGPENVGMETWDLTKTRWLFRPI